MLTKRQFIAVSAFITLTNLAASIVVVVRHPFKDEGGADNRIPLLDAAAIIRSVGDLYTLGRTIYNGVSFFKDYRKGIFSASCDNNAHFLPTMFSGFGAVSGVTRTVVGLLDRCLPGGEIITPIIGSFGDCFDVSLEEERNKLREPLLPTTNQPK